MPICGVQRAAECISLLVSHFEERAAWWLDFQRGLSGKNGESAQSFLMDFTSGYFSSLISFPSIPLSPPLLPPCPSPSPWAVCRGDAWGDTCYARDRGGDEAETRQRRGRGEAGARQSPVAWRLILPLL